MGIGAGNDLRSTGQPVGPGRITVGMKRAEQQSVSAGAGRPFSRSSLTAGRSGQQGFAREDRLIEQAEGMAASVLRYHHWVQGPGSAPGPPGLRDELAIQPKQCGPLPGRSTLARRPFWRASISVSICGSRACALSVALFTSRHRRRPTDCQQPDPYLDSMVGNRAQFESRPATVARRYSDQTHWSDPRRTIRLSNRVVSGVSNSTAQRVQVKFVAAAGARPWHSSVRPAPGPKM